MKLDYFKEPSGDPKRPWFKRPLIPVRLRAGDRTATIMALIDSGADISLFSSSLADVLGLDLQSGRAEQIQGISGQPVSAYFHTVTLEIVGSPDSFTADVAFSEQLAGTALLGQADFFEQFQIKFERYLERIELKRAPNH
jgi:hypothetical protein